MSTPVAVTEILDGKATVTIEKKGYSGRDTDFKCVFKNKEFEFYFTFNLSNPVYTLETLLTAAIAEVHKRYEMYSIQLWQEYKDEFTVH